MQHKKDNKTFKFVLYERFLCLSMIIIGPLVIITVTNKCMIDTLHFWSSFLLL